MVPLRLPVVVSSPVMGRRIRSWYEVGVFVVAWALSACQALAGIADLRSGELPGSGSTDDAGKNMTDDGGTGAADADSSDVTADGGTGAADADAGDVTLGGEVAYLKPGRSVVLTTGTQDVTVTGDGAFTFPARLGTSAPYAVTVKTQPAGQFCWVLNGAGAAAGANVSGVDVRCSLVFQAREAGAAQTSTSSNVFAPLPGTSSTTFTLPRATKMLLALHASDLASNFADTGVDAAVEIGVRVDGAAPIAIVNRQPHEGGPCSLSTTAIATLAAGAHTVTGVWRKADTSNATAVVRVGNAGYGTELDVIALDSLPSFDAAKTTLLTAAPELPANTTAFASLDAKTSLSLPAAQPVFMSAQIPAVWGDRVVGALTVDDTAVAAGKYSFDTNAFRLMSFTPSIVDVLAPGSHTLDATWARVEGGSNKTSTRRQPSGPLPDGAVSAVVFKASTASGAKKASGSFVVPNTRDWSTLSLGGSALRHDITTTHPDTSVLVVFHTSTLRPMGTPDHVADLGVALDGTVANLSRARTSSYLDWNTTVMPLVAVVKVPAVGSHTLELRMRSNRSEPRDVEVASMASANQLTNFSFVVLD
jgi:hypothetical protein